MHEPTTKGAPMSHIPEGMTSVTPYLIVDGAPDLIDFLETAFDAEVLDRTDGDDGAIRHASVRLAGSIVEISDARDEWPARPGSIHLYVEDCDAAYRRAIEAGATSLFEVADMFYGERSGGVVDPQGNHWYIATHTGRTFEEG